jgi:hypothetical protein
MHRYPKHIVNPPNLCFTDQRGLPPAGILKYSIRSAEPWDRIQLNTQWQNVRFALLHDTAPNHD